MSSDPRMKAYLRSLMELGAVSRDEEFSAFGAALKAGDALQVVTTEAERSRNQAAIDTHQMKLDWLHSNGYLGRRQQKWFHKYKPKPEDHLFLYRLTAQGCREAL